MYATFVHCTVVIKLVCHDVVRVVRLATVSTDTCSVWFWCEIFICHHTSRMEPYLSHDIYDVQSIYSIQSALNTYLLKQHLIHCLLKTTVMQHTHLTDHIPGQPQRAENTLMHQRNHFLLSPVLVWLCINSLLCLLQITAVSLFKCKLFIFLSTTSTFSLNAFHLILTTYLSAMQINIYICNWSRI